MKDPTRIFDVIISFFALLVLLPFFIFIFIIIKINSKGPALFLQKRVGKNDIEFTLIKFRTMRINSEQKSSLTIGIDNRITSFGNWLRKYKLDELPQLWNVFIGDMSIVGPRPELRKYVDLYSIEQRKILSIKPGITDTASIQFRNENQLLAQSADPEQYYITEIMPLKIVLNNHYLKQKNLKNYFLIIFNTLSVIINK